MKVDSLMFMVDRNRRRFQLSTIILHLMIMLALSSCDSVLQYPDEPDADESGVNLYLNINVNDTIHLLGEYEYDFTGNEAKIITRSKPIQEALAQHQIRLTLRAFHLDDKSVHPTPIFTRIYAQPLTSNVNRTLKFKIPAGDYRLVMWIDHVDENSMLDKYYDTSDFSEIILNNNGGHYGSNDHRDAFYGETTICVPENIDDDVHAQIDLQRPMAKYVFISNDFKEFYDNELSRMRSTDMNAPSRAPELSDYTVRVVYTRYMTSAFNAFTGKPADSRTGVEYQSLISIIDEEHAQLAFDYIFTNGSETSVNVAMEVLYKDGSLVSRMAPFDVPLKRSHRTVITGKFLTTKSGGDIGINPDYDGSFNIEIL